MTSCSTCGFQNGPMDAFCGSCGAYLGGNRTAAGASAGTAAGASAGMSPESGAGARATSNDPTQPIPGQQVPFQRAGIPPGPVDRAAYNRSSGTGAGGVRCGNCGLFNPPGRRFCRSCGAALGAPTEPAVGVVPRQMARRQPPPSGGGQRALIGLLILGLAVVIVAAALAFSGILGGGPAATGSPRASSVTGVVSPTIGAPTLAASGEPGATPGASPGETVAPTATLKTTPRPTRSPKPTPKPTPSPGATPTPTLTPSATATGTPNASPSPGPTPLPTVGPPAAFVCPGDADQVTAIADTLMKNWKLTSYSWASHSRYDRLTFHLTRLPGSNPEIADVTVQPSAPSDMPSLGLPQPTGAWALPVGFFGGTKQGVFGSQTFSFPALQQITLAKDSGGSLYAVVGVNGPGCYQLRVPAWPSSNPQPQKLADVVLDIQH